MQAKELLMIFLLVSTSFGAEAYGQTTPQIGLGANSQAISGMSEAQILNALRTEGRVSLSGAFFETDSATLSSGAEQVLTTLASVLNALPDARLAVVGHTDNSGDFSSNRSLSESRAQAVVDALTEPEMAIDPARLVALGVGSIDPIASNLSEEGKALNRRVTFVVIDDADNLEAVSGSDGAWLQDPITDCLIWTSGDDVQSEGAAWTGSCINGMANGRGSLVFWDAEGFEARYDGDVLNGKADGVGKVWYRADDGSGFDSIQGTFSSGQPVGDVTIVSSDGYVFEGELFADVNHGEGKLTSPDGWAVDGEIKDGEAVGTAVIYYETDEGEIYFGEAENKKRQGFGTLIGADDSSYVGQFDQGTPSGNGMFEGPSGAVFLGQFAGGAPNGVGTAIDPDGTSYQGRFIDGVADGEIRVTAPDGSQTVEMWIDGSKSE